MLSAPRTRSARLRTVSALLGVIGVAGALAACDDSSEAQPSDETTGYVLGCGLVDEDLVVEVMGGDVASDGFGEQPRDQVSDCDITKVGQEGHFMLIRARYPTEAELSRRRTTWPERPADIAGCRGTWVAPGPNAFGAACVEDDVTFESTLLSALWGDVSVNVTIGRPDGALPSDAPDAYRISRSVAEHLSR